MPISRWMDKKKIKKRWYIYTIEYYEYLLLRLICQGEILKFQLNTICDMHTVLDPGCYESIQGESATITY